METNIFDKVKTTFRIIGLIDNWPTFLACYFRLNKNSDVMIKFRNGLKWHIDSSKKGFGCLTEVWLSKPYALLFKEKNPKVILDFGAHIGSFSILAATKYPDAKIYAYEASKETFALLNKNIKENNLKNIKAFNTGIADKDGVLKFYINEKSTAVNSFDSEFLKHENSEKRKSYDVQCKKISTIFSELGIEHCDFIKLDIERFEMPLLKSAEKDNLLGKIDAVAGEFTEPDEIKEATRLLEKHGFSVRLDEPNQILNAMKENNGRNG